MEENTVKQYCSFCGKSEDEVLKLIEGPNGIAICDECIEECNDILEREYEEADTPKNDAFKLLTPEEIKARLDEYIIGQDAAKKSVVGCRLQSLQKDRKQQKNRRRRRFGQKQRIAARTYRLRKDFTCAISCEYP